MRKDRHLGLRRGVAPILIALVLGAAAAPAPTAAAGSIVLNQGEEVTNNPVVTVQISAPTDDSGLIRLSNDNSSWSDPRPWQSTISWNIGDAATGGTTDDGPKTVWVQFDDGTNTWTAAGSDSIIYDTTPPDVYDNNVFCDYVGGWIARNPCWPGGGDGYGLDHSEFSMDGGPWTSTEGVWPYGLDFRTLRYGGGWRSENREVCVRWIDAAGNASGPTCTTRDLNIANPAVGGNADWYDVRFEFPLPAVTGQPFTIKPVFPENFPESLVMDKGLCEWIFSWGDETMSFNENFGQVWMTKLYKNGGCEPWTFTLPYTPGLHYEFSFTLKDKWYGKTFAQESGGPYMEPRGTMFTATVGTTERGITESNHGLAYLIPNKFEAQVGEEITYTLHQSFTPGYTLPSPAWFWAYSNDCGGNVGDDHATRSHTFTYAPTCQGNWVTGWTWENSTTREYLRATFDPPADMTPPVVSLPQAAPSAGAQASTTIATRITWTASDPLVRKVSSGLAKTQLQVSRNGGAWSTVALPSSKATAVVVNLQPSGSYRYRVRAFDDAGNRSAWKTGPVLKPRMLAETAATFTGSWATQTASSLTGGKSATTASPGAATTLAFNGRSISWIGSVGPLAGLAQVYVDGSLAQTIDLNSSSATDRRLIFTRTWAALGNHTLRIVALGTYDRPNVSIDGFVVTN
ncbi:MAG TPA: hypothetical protein VMZ66_11590 [Aeromicrobium sp.]|nr:hypothetical protein [Aeromicrobium sp.]